MESLYREVHEMNIKKGIFAPLNTRAHLSVER